MPKPALTKASNIRLRAQKAAGALRRGEAKPLKVNDKLREAIELMVHRGMERPEAARAVGLTDHGLRNALKKPHVLAVLNEEEEVLRTSLRPRALHKMGRLLSAQSENVQFKAAEYLHGENRGIHTLGAQQINVQLNNHVTVEQPGYVIDLSEPAHGAQQIEHLAQDVAKPLIEHDDVPDEG